jgi:hypothetical protein
VVLSKKNTGNFALHNLVRTPLNFLINENIKYVDWETQNKNFRQIHDIYVFKLHFNDDNFVYYVRKIESSYCLHILLTPGLYMH